MPLGSRELLLMVRARDLASGTFRQIGSGMRAMGTQGSIAASHLLGASAALTSAGTTLGLVGAAGLGFLNSATNAAIDYNRQTALTMTQVDGVKTSIEELGAIGLRVAESIPAPFEQIQESLYDIFSSIDATVPQAELMLDRFARASVAGQTDLQQAGRATIAIMNGLQIPIEEIDRIMDVQFQTVRKGVVTYEEFSQNIGQAIPAAQRAGQSIETIGGMFAFLTRNGLDASMASTSIARSLELFARPKVAERLWEMGVATRDAHGNFRQINDVVTDLGQKLVGLPKPQQVAILEELFKGEGNRIQARRFFDTALVGFDELNERVGEMHNSAGALSDAYDIMFNAPASQADLLSNKIQALKIRIGEGLIPVKMELVKWASRLVDWWNGLSDNTRDLITKFVLFSSIAAVVVGGLMTLAGAFLGLVAVVALLTGSIGLALGIVGGLTVAIPLLIAAGIALYKNWDTLREWAYRAWEQIAQIIKSAMTYVEDIIDEVMATITTIWDGLTDVAVNTWNTVGAAFTAGADMVETTGKTFGDVFDDIKKKFKEWKDKLMEVPEVQKAWDLFNIAWRVIWDQMRRNFDTALSALATGIDWLKMVPISLALQWQAMAPLIAEAMRRALLGAESSVVAFAAIWRAIWDTLWANTVAVLRELETAFRVFSGIVSTLWGGLGTALGSIWNAAWEYIKGIVPSAGSIIAGAINAFLGAITGNWDRFAKGIGQIWNGMWNALSTAGAAQSAVVRAIWDFWLTGMRNAANFVFPILQGAWRSLWQNMDNIAKMTSGGIIGVVTRFLNDAKNLFAAHGPAILSHVQTAWTNILNVVRMGGGGMLSSISSAISTIAGVWSGGWDGIRNRLSEAWRLMLEITIGRVQAIVTVVSGLPGKILSAVGNLGSLLYNAGRSVVQGLINGIESMFGAVGGVLGRLTSLIPSWKGPPPKDATLLYDNGQLIIQGLQRGLVSEFANTEKLLSNFSNDMSGSISTNPFGTSTPVGSRQQRSQDISVTIAQGAIVVSGVENADQAAQTVIDSLEEIIREAVSG